jgi:peptidoglycan/LPS O-acetylase OafA/YrhL
MVPDGPTPASPYRYRHFGGFRLLLASLVMLQHFGADLAPEPLMLVLAPYRLGDMAVLVFFALSGFVITNAVDAVYQSRPGAFLGNRLLRILPHFILAVAWSMAAHQLFSLAGGERLWRSQESYPDAAFGPLNVILNFFGVIPLLDRAIDYNFLDITWAIRVEMAFYVIMAACIAIGRMLPGTRGFAKAGVCTVVLLIPLFALTISGRGIGMFAFLPYFVFGVALYFASVGRRTGWLVVALSVPAMLWQCITQSNALAAGSEHLAVSGNVIVLVVLLCLMTALTFTTIARGRQVDETLGALTYPLYLYHENVLVIILTFTVGYSYFAFVGGIVLSLAVAVAATALIDPLVNRYRDLVRGGALQRQRADVQAMSTTSLPSTG